MAIERIKVNLIPTGTMPVCSASQYDKGRKIGLDIYNGLQPYILSDETVELDIRKSDGRIVTLDVPVTARGNSVVFETTEQMCAVAGANLCELRLIKNGTDVGSANFSMQIERSPMENGLLSESEINNLARQVHDAVVEELEDNGASETGYDNTESGLEATNVQDAIDELANKSPEDVYTKEETEDKFATKTALEEVAEDIPTKTSELTNDSDFVTMSAVETELPALVEPIVEDIVPTVIGGNYYNKTQTDAKMKEPLNLTEAKITNNEINLLNCLYGYYVNHNNGSIERSNDYVTTEYIPVEPQKRYVSFKTNHYAWYDENKEFISGSNTVVNELAPANAKYICLDFTRDNKGVAFFKIGYVAPFDKKYGIDFPWLDNKNPINPERFNQWGAYYANLFNKYTAIDGYYVKHDTGERATSGTYFLSDYIRVKPNTTYVMSRGNRYAVYDSDYQYITGANLNGTDVEFTTPNNAMYMLVCNTPLTRKDEFVVAEKSVYSSIYESFGIVVPWIKPKVAKSKYDGKRLICFGDSITSMGYVDTIIADTGMLAQNVGLSSGRYAYADDANIYVNAFAFHNIVDAIVSGDWTIPDSISGVSGYEIQYQHIQEMKLIDFSAVDFVSIAYGTNDFSSATPLDNQNDPLDVNTFKGAIRYCLKVLTENFPNLKIIGVTPCYRFWVESGAVLYDSDEHPIGGMYLSEFIEAIEEVYNEYHLPVVNNYNNAGINKYNRLQYFNITDGLHPKINGRAILGHRIGSGILLNY